MKMPQSAFKGPKDRSWVAEALKELGRPPKIQGSKPQQAQKTTTKDLIIIEEKANYEDSMRTLKEQGFRPLTYLAALIMIDKDPELKEQLKGKWFYLNGKGTELSGLYTFNDKGEVTPGEGDTEKTVFVLEGSQPLFLYVHADNDALSNERRFVLGAYDGPSNVAPVVVGVQA